MYKKFLLSIITFFVLIVFFLPHNVNAFLYNDYYINSYNIDIIVNENNTFDITQTIDVNFIAPREAIYIKIPLRNDIKRQNGTTSNNLAKISNLYVSEEHKILKDLTYKIIKIGNYKKPLKGSHIYTIKYTYDIGKDPLPSSDELCFTLINNEWDADIFNANFTITMPKEFNGNNITFFSEFANLIKEINVTYTVEGNVIKGEIDSALTPRNSLMINVPLPEGYFVRDDNNLDYGMIIKIILSIIFVIIAYMIWVKKGKDKDLNISNQYYPPENINSLDAAFLYKGYTDNSDVLSLLIHLANKGYLAMEHSDENKDNFKILKLKEYDGNNEIEKMFFDELFMYGEEVTNENLHDVFYNSLNNISNIVNKKENEEKIYEKTSIKSNIFITIMIFIIMIFMDIGLIFNIDDPRGAGIILPILIVPLMFLYRKPNIFKILLTSLAFVGVGLFFSMIDISADPVYIIEFTIESVCIVFLIVFLGIIKKRSKYGNEMLEKLQGLKNFITTAKKEELEQLVSENPKYFFDILPYAYSLRVSKSWFKNFKDINIDRPKWYNGPLYFNINEVNENINFIYNKIYSILFTNYMDKLNNEVQKRM